MGLMMGTIRVILADDHAVLRIGVRSLLEEMPESRSSPRRPTAIKRWRWSRRIRPDVLVTDIAMPGLNGLELARLVVNEHPAIRVLILSMHKEKAFATKALASGAAGYLLKEASTYELADCGPGRGAWRGLSQPGSVGPCGRRLCAAGAGRRRRLPTRCRPGSVRCSC